MIRSTERILSDVHKVMAGLEALIAETAGRAEDRIDGAAGRIDGAAEHLQSKLEHARARLADIEHEIEGGASSAARTAGELVGASPWASFASVAAVAFLAGLAISPRRRRFSAGATARHSRNGTSGDEWLDTSG
jgi:ElaB/YqjD/DUF883 family membrane-anchored ribosome-binding protein